MLGEQTILSGHEVQGDNEHTYVLRLVDGAWQGEPRPTSIQVVLQGTSSSIVLAQVEDGTYLFEGTPVNSGDIVSVSGKNYRLTQGAGGRWRTTLTTAPTLPPPGGGQPGEPLTTDTLASYVGVSPRVRLTESGSSASRQGSILELNGIEYSVNALFTHGRDQRETTFAEEAFAQITSELIDIEKLIGLVDSTTGLTTEIERRWDDIAQHLDTLFPGEGSRLLGRDTPKDRSGRIDYEEVVEDIQDVLAALSTSSAFRDAVDDGIFSGSYRVDVDDSDDTFFAVRRSTRLGFGWTSSTRYGAYSKRDRTSISRALNFAPGTEGIGAFGYSPLETTRTRDLPSSGVASYFGETIAASADVNQTIYSGEIEIHVRFASRRVSALVTNLQDAGGRPWRYSLRDVDSINLPSATLHASNGSFEVASSRTASISFFPPYGGSAARSLRAEFDGRFVGRGEAAGKSAIGTWSLTSGSAVILAGGFGVDTTSAPSRPPPVVRPVDPSGDFGQEAATYLGARPNSSGNIVIEARDSDNDRIELPASELYADGGAIVPGERLFEKARATLQDQITLIGVYRDLFSGSQALQLRQALWRTANQSLRDNVFGNLETYALGVNYPSGSSLDRRDDNAVELLQDAQAALSSSANFRDAVEDGGVFEDILNQSKLESGDYDFSDIYAALDYELEVKYDNTDHGRFGVWAKRVRDNALSPVTTATGDERSGVFAYSPIGQTEYLPRDANFPTNFNSTYVGRTVAVDTSAQGSRLYDGDIYLTVRWGTSPRAYSTSVTSVIENLATSDTGEPLLIGGYDVRQLIFDSDVDLDSQNRIKLTGTRSVRVRYFDPSRPERFHGTISSEGKFVGYNVSGPQAVIGTWEWSREGFKGAFGADLVP